MTYTPSRCRPCPRLLVQRGGSYIRSAYPRPPSAVKWIPLFEDLPPNWTDLPLTSATLAGDVVDLVLNESLRAENSLLLLPCDPQGVGYPTPVVLGDTDWFVSGHQRHQMLQRLAELDVPTVVIAVSSSRPIPARVIEDWYCDVQAAFTTVGTRMIGFFSVWAHHVHEVTGAEPGGAHPQAGGR